MRRLRKKYKRPRRPWDAARIKDEKAMLNEYGLRRKRELRKAEAILRNFRHRARKLISTQERQKQEILISTLRRRGLLPETASLDDVLALGMKSILERRLQTQVFRKGLAKTPLQARQLIVHGKITVDGRKTVYPSYMVTVEEEGKIAKVENDRNKEKTKAGEAESQKAGEVAGEESGAGETQAEKTTGKQAT